MAGIDSSAKLMLHMDGDDASTTFTDSSLSPYTVTAVGNAQIDTAQSVFGGASGLFDGTGDYLTTIDSADWQLDGGSDSNAWTIDFRVRFNGDPGTADVGFIQQFASASESWGLMLDAGTKLRFRVDTGGSTIVDVKPNWNPADATWYHIAVVKNGTTGYMHFVNGTQIGVTTVDTSTIPNYAGGLQIARYTNPSSVNKDLNGWMDELRVSKGVARWTADFTPPTSAYSVDNTFFPKMMLMGVG